MLDRTRGSYTALVTEVQLGILRGELGVPQKMRARPRRAAAPSFLEGTSGDKLAAPSPGPECEIYLGMSRSGTLGESTKSFRRKRSVTLLHCSSVPVRGETVCVNSLGIRGTVGLRSFSLSLSLSAGGGG